MSVPVTDPSSAGTGAPDGDDTHSSVPSSAHSRPDAAERAGVAATALVVALARWLFAADRRIFHIYHDEPAQLAMARWLSGRQPWTLFDLETWQPGYATLVAPLYRISADITTVYRLAIVLNACLAGASALLLAFLARRLTSLPLRRCLPIAGVIAVLPAALSSSGYTWAEPLITLLVIGVISLTLRFLDAPTAARGAAAVVLAGAGYIVHGRLLPLVAVVGAIVVGHEVWRRRWASAGVVAVVAGVSMLLARLYVRAVRDAVWESPGSLNSPGSTLRMLARPDAVLSSLVGQLWYQLAATAGVFGIGLIVLVARAAGRSVGADLPEPGRRDALVTLAILLPLVGVSVLFMARESRPDQLIYGRYNDAVVWPIIAVGAAVITRLPSIARTKRALSHPVVAAAIALVVLGVVVQLWHGDRFRENLGVRAMIAGLMPVVGRSTTFAPIVVTLVSVAVLAALLAIRHVSLTAEPSTSLSRSLFAVLVATIVVAAGVLTYSSFTPSRNFYASAAEVRAIRGIVPEGTTIGWHFMSRDEPVIVFTSAQRRSALLYQAYLPDYRIVTDRGAGDGVGPYVFAPLGDPTLADEGAELLWSSESSGIALYRERDTP